MSRHRPVAAIRRELELLTTILGAEVNIRTARLDSGYPSPWEAVLSVSERILQIQRELELALATAEKGVAS